jgi:twinkle protein
VLPVSVPFGAKWKGQDKDRPSPNREWLDTCWDWLQGFETVLVAMDSDDAGRRAAADIIAEVGPRRCRLVELPKDANDKPYKDANDCLLAGVPAAEMRYQVEHGRDFAPEKVIAMADREEEFLTWVFERELEPGIALPFEFPFRIRPGEMTVWTGIEGSGKTTLLDFVLVAAIHQGERGFIASFEVPWQQTLEKVNRQALGELLYDKRIVKRCTPDELANYRGVAREQTRRAYRWLSPNIWFYDHVGIGRWRTLIDDIRWTRRRHGTTQVAIDNFMRLGIAKDDYAQQADAITAFASLAMELGIHIHMVVHQNKTEGKKESGGKRSVSGAFEIIANAHNIVEVIRDKSKGEKVSELYEAQKIGAITSEAEFSSKKRALDLLPDGNFTLHKQRNGDVQDGRKYLWFLWESQQYADKPPGHAEHAPVRFVRQPIKPADLPTDEELGLDK